MRVSLIGKAGTNKAGLIFSHHLAAPVLIMGHEGGTYNSTTGQGNYSYDDAVAECSNRGMRLANSWEMITHPYGRNTSSYFNTYGLRVPPVYAFNYYIADNRNVYISADGNFVSSGGKRAASFKCVW